jgi:hypothetical protein
VRASRPGFVCERTFKYAYERDAMFLRVLDRPTLKPVRREEQSLVCPHRAFLVGENLHVLALYRSSVVFALDEQKEVDAKVLEPDRDVYSVCTVIRCHQLLLVDFEALQTRPKTTKHIRDEDLELFAVKLGSMVSPWWYRHNAILLGTETCCDSVALLRAGNKTSAA